MGTSSWNLWSEHGLLGNNPSDCIAVEEGPLAPGCRCWLRPSGLLQGVQACGPG